MNIGIVGYGNLGRGVEAALTLCPDMKLSAVFTRRDPGSISIQTAGVPVLSYDKLDSMRGEIDVMILCGGSATDLPQMTPEVAEKFHVIDSFDNHSQIPAHFEAVDKAAQKGGKIAVISVGWDPGLFSLNRLYAGAILPQGTDYTFWGRGVSQGHSDAVRRLPGVKDARQYTLPVPEAVEQVRRGENPQFTTREKHTRLCYVVLEEGADEGAVETAIKTMPGYFADYDTTVKFISEEEMKRDHSGLPHGGMVIRNGTTGFQGEHRQTIAFELTLDSNPEFTASVLVACARAAYRMAQKGEMGCKTIFDLPPALLSPKSGEELRRTML